jgi:hypothetical protein
MAAPHSSAKAQEDHALRPLQRGRHYALPKSHCANRSEWRVLPGKPPERLSPYYQLGCEFGSSLMIAWRKYGNEPIYVCEEHAKELGHSANVRASAGNLPGDVETNNENGTSTEASPAAVPKQASSDPSKSANSTSEAHRKAARRAQSPAERCAAINRLISELATQLENILSQSETTIAVANTIDIALEQATLEIIQNHALTEPQKDATIQQLGALQESLKQDVGQEITPLRAHQIKQTVGDFSVADEARPAYRAVYDSLENAIHTAAPKAKHLEKRLANLLKMKAELENFRQANELAPQSPELVLSKSS